jgi:hypothetical protein
MSPRLLLQPACVSYLFLGLTLWLLTSRAGPGRPARWLLPPLFVLWVNLDHWFLLGPATVALFSLGDILQGRAAKWAGTSPAEARPPVLFLAVGLAACLVNPYGIRAFTLPWELGLSPAAEALAQDGQFRALFASPLQELSAGTAGGAGAALAYLALAVLGLISFGLTWGAWGWWRVLTWLAFLLLSLVSSRCVPFFAVVAAPITSLNFLDFSAGRFGTAVRKHQLRGAHLRPPAPAAAQLRQRLRRRAVRQAPQPGDAPQRRPRPAGRHALHPRPRRHR